MSNKPSYGDLVDVKDEDGNVIARGVVNIPAIPGVTVNDGYAIDTTFADGFSSTGDVFLSGVNPDNVEPVEGGECYGQKWQRRCFGY